MDGAEYIQKIVGGSIREARIAMNITQVRLAEKCKLSPSFITEIENGRKYPSVYTLYQFRLSNIFLFLRTLFLQIDGL